MLTRSTDHRNHQSFHMGSANGDLRQDGTFPRDRTGGELPAKLANWELSSLAVRRAKADLALTNVKHIVLNTFRSIDALVERSTRPWKRKPVRLSQPGNEDDGGFEWRRSGLIEEWANLTTTRQTPHLTPFGRGSSRTMTGCCSRRPCVGCQIRPKSGRWTTMMAYAPGSPIRTKWLIWRARLARAFAL